MRKSSYLLLLMALSCKNQTDPVVDADTDTDTDTDSDTDADSDADTDCASTVVLNAGVTGAVGFDPNNTFEWDQGYALSACVTPGTSATGEANVFMQVMGGGPTNAYCATTFAVAATPASGCDDCDFAFEPGLTETGSIDVLTPIKDNNCSYLADVVMPAWGVDLDGGKGSPALLFDEGKGGWNPVGPATVTEIGTQVRVDWVWSEFYSLD